MSIKRHDGRPRPRRVPVTQSTGQNSIAWLVVTRELTFVLATLFASNTLFAAGGLLVVTTEDETSAQPIVSRMELYRGNGTAQIVRTAAGAGRGTVIAESVELSLPDGAYQFRLQRGPEYRIVSGNFTLERTSKDDRTVLLPRMVEMKNEGWLSCDMAVPPKTNDLRLRMFAEDLHLAAIVGEEAAPLMPQAIPENLEPYKPTWVATGLKPTNDDDLVFYPPADSDVEWPVIQGETSSQMIERLAAGDAVRVAVLNPFAWELPVWLASEQIDGVFVLGDWLREDKRVEKIVAGRPPRRIGFEGPRGPGRYAEFIYWQILEAGLRPVPLAGTGTKKGQSATTPIGYNRVYVTGKQSDEDESSRQELSSTADFLAAAWAGQSIVTNGPMLRPTLGGFPPGHSFQASAGETLDLSMELKLAVRDEVEYMEIVHNGRVFHCARLDEFAAAGGRLPVLHVEESGWVMVRVVTQHEDHFRMATSAPWYIDFNSQSRISQKAVEFFLTWLVDCEARLKQLPAETIAKHVPSVSAARTFWRERLANATVD